MIRTHKYVKTRGEHVTLAGSVLSSLSLALTWMAAAGSQFISLNGMGDVTRAATPPAASFAFAASSPPLKAASNAAIVVSSTSEDASTRDPRPPSSVQSPRAAPTRSSSLTMKTPSPSPPSARVEAATPPPTRKSTPAPRSLATPAAGSTSETNATARSRREHGRRTIFVVAVEWKKQCTGANGG